MKILVTGGTTFVSKFAAQYFTEKGNRVTVINRGNRQQVNGVSLICCDRLSLKDSLKNKHFDIILDITAYTEEHIKTLLNSGVTFDNYVFVSSSAVYPETNTQPFSEEQKCGYNSIWGDYGLNKLKAEQFLSNNVKNYYILRPPYLYGVYENLYREGFVFDCAMQNRKFYIPENSNMKLQFFNVYDLCRFIEIIVEKQPENRIYNVGNPESVTIKEWVSLCYAVADKIPEFVYVKDSISQRDYFCFRKYEYILDVSEMSKLMENTLSLEQGIKDEFHWYKLNPESVYYKKPYIEFIERNLVNNVISGERN